MMKNFRFIILVLLVPMINLQLCLKAGDRDSTKLLNKFQYYKDKYKVECADEKITDNFGNGNDSLYGTRNMRVILHGVAYRGGANNFYNKFGKRDNHNPLPPGGLQNLCLQGFSNSVYLYSKNFSEAEKVFVNDATNDTIHYLQNSGSDRNNLKKIMLMLLDVIHDSNKGPIYLHCWNGWHQSGYVASTILMQFCGISNQQALKYWNHNTDGVNKGYENVKNMVRNFVPFDDIKISESIKKSICPCLDKDK